MAGLASLASSSLRLSSAALSVRGMAVAAAAGRRNLKNPVVAIAGVTGAVGQEFLACLEQRKFPIGGLKLLASSRSVGKKYKFQGKEYAVEEMTDKSFDGVDIALFSAGGAQSKKFAPLAVKSGCVVVDNSSAFRMDPTVPLVVPEINPQATFKHNGIIANPNCSTIIMAVAVHPLHKAGKVKRLVIATYQAASGAGAVAMEELKTQAKEWVENKPLSQAVFGRQYIFNLFSHNSKIDLASGYNEEETKLLKETHKIFEDNSIRITGTCVRVPVLRAHCEAINIELTNPLTESKVREILGKAPGVTVLDDRANNKHPEPILASGKDNVLVGRIRPDWSQPAGLGYDIFVSGDQLLKGAALNAVQIAELLLAK